MRRLAELTEVDLRTLPVAATFVATGEITWQEELARECAQGGMHARRVIWPIREAIGATRRATPLASTRRRSNGEFEWFALIDRTRERVLVTLEEGSSRWMGVDALLAWLGESDLDAPRSWVLVESRFPSAIVPDGDGQASKHFDPKRPFRRLVELLRPDHEDLWAFLLFASLIGGLTLATPIAVQQLVNSIAFGGLIQPVVVLALLLFAVLTFSAMLSAIQAFVAEMIQRRMFVRVVIDVAERLPRVRMSAFDLSHGPELVNRVFDVVTIQKVGSQLLLEGTAVLLQTVVGLIVLSFYHPLMLGFSGLLIAGILIVMLVMGRGAVHTAVEESKTKYAVVQWLEELARHPSTFRESAERGYARRRADALASGYVRARQTHYRIVLRQYGGALALQVMASSAALALGGVLVVQGQLTLGQLVAAELIITVIVAAVAKFGKQLEGFYDMLAAMEKLSRIMDLPLERESGGDLEARVEPARVALTGIDFSYESHGVLKHFELEIEPGERLAVQGAMGSGKSSLLDLLAGLREPSSGWISLDGKDYRDIRLEALREAVALVREPEIFNGTILENLRVGRDQLEYAEILETLDEVGLLEEIRALPEGLETLLATGGRPLSQVGIARLMLARALLGRPRLLLIDRGLEHLDEVACARICEVLFAPSAPWTLVVVSERSDVLDRCTRRIALGAPEVWSDGFHPAGRDRVA